jgi:DNA polymerase-3 subunit beta
LLFSVQPFFSAKQLGTNFKGVFKICALIFPDVGDAKETMPAAFEGEPLEIGFNPEYLKEGIESVEGDEVVLRLISPLRPGLLQPVDSEDFRYLVMPIRLNA